jgi:hypothetical protein
MNKVFCVLLAAALYPASAPAQVTVTSIGAWAVRAADDFATRAFQDPWDMQQRTDLGWFLHGTDQPHSNLTNLSFANGIFSATATTNDPNFFLLETGNPEAARHGKVGLNYPINADKYQLIAFRMNTSPATDNTQFIWNRETIYDHTTTTGYNVPTTSGWRTYVVDLRTLARAGASPVPWSGVIKSLRMDPMTTTGSVALDWVRLVEIDSALCRTITWTGAVTVDIYIDNDSNPGNGTLGRIAVNALATADNAASASHGCPTTGAGYKFYAGALAPGTYHVAVVGAGQAPAAGNYASTTWVVNDIPTVSFISPSPEGSADDFATTFLNNPWDMDSLGDIDFMANITSPRIENMNLETPAGVSLGSTRVFRGASVPAPGSIDGDPHIAPLYWVTGRGFNNRIDTNRYRILTVDLGIPDKPRNILTGSIVRVVWKVAGMNLESVSDDIILNHRAGANVLDTINLDMADRDVLKIEEGAFAGGQGWINGSSPNPGLDIFRVDPHEFPTATEFYIRRIKLAALERANTSYTIQWAYSDSQAGTVSLFFERDEKNPSIRQPIPGGNDLPTTSAGSFVWNTSTMPPGTYYIYASVTDGVNENGTYAKWPIVIDPTFTDPASIAVSRPTLNFGVTSGTVKTPAQTVGVTVVGSGNPCWTVDNPLPTTFIVDGGSGCGNGQFTVRLVDQFYAALGVGEASLVVREVTPNTIANSPQYVRAWIRIHGSTTGPTGTVDTPGDGVTVSGSVPVTGWVVDDIHVQTIQVFRAPVSGEGPEEVFIGNATRVDDARPDIQGLFGDAPFNYRAGWGYMMLTNFLPGGGDGSYQLRVYATDLEGNRVLLGTRNITGANSAATRPFGAIDTPGQGETVSGIVTNFGWVLQRGPFYASPAWGGTVNVVIDGLAVGQPSGWTAREDLTALFPASTYPGITHALGVFQFNSAAYANGVHTIAWGVVGTNAEGDGIGSRYFTIANTSSSLTTAEHQPYVVPAPPVRAAGRAVGLPVSALGSARRLDAVQVFLGGSARLTTAEALPDGTRVVAARSLQRLELRLPGPAPSSDDGLGAWEAYSVVDGRLEGLPIGSTFDDRGAFYWLPGLGFSGVHDLVFVRDGRQVPVRVLLDAAPRRAVSASLQPIYRSVRFQ